ncbi:MAG TPA: DUF3298 domain-containing protein [Bryobacteraceae bacterium]|nr:DUF3298 domain-containing protein [Bryobacteraceae bacterium]
MADNQGITPMRAAPQIRRRWLRAALCLSLCAAGLPAASFDCALASTAREHTICADAKLSQVDEELAAAYQRVVGSLTRASAETVREDQREWADWLGQVCPDHGAQPRGMAACLANEYSIRVRMLRDGLRRIGGVTFFPRLLVVIASDKGTPAPGSADPGFGVGRFHWPQIDAPSTLEQSGWNRAVRELAARMAQREGSPPAPDEFDPSLAADSDVNVFYTLRAANSKLISVEVGNERYNYGAAHPWESVTCFNWLLDPRRELSGEDVFQPGSGWEAFLGERAWEKLKASEHAKDLYADSTAHEAALRDAARVEGWTVTADGLEILFPEYSVAPRLAGMLTVNFAWDELKPYLAAGFDPAALPPPLQAGR